MLWRAVAITVALVSVALGQTDQRPGPDGVFGKAIQVGVQAPLYFTLKSVEYNAARVMVDKYIWPPGHDEKLVIIHYSIQNPTKRAVNYTGSSPKFELCDADNHSFGPLAVGIGMGLDEPGKRVDEVPGKRVDMALQPAQTIQVYTGFRVPAEAICKKLIVLPTSATEPVVRYDLSGHITGLVPPYVDPQDETKALRLPEFAATKGEWYPLARYDLRLDSPLTAQAGPPDKLAKGTRWMLATVSLRTPGQEPFTAALAKFTANVRLADDRDIKAHGLYSAQSWDRLDQEVRPKSELVVRFAFMVPEAVEPKTLRVEAKGFDGSRRHSHTLRYDCGPAAAPPPAG